MVFGETSAISFGILFKLCYQYLKCFIFTREILTNLVFILWLSCLTVNSDLIVCYNPLGWQQGRKPSIRFTLQNTPSKLFSILRPKQPHLEFYQIFFHFSDWFRAIIKTKKRLSENYYDTLSTERLLYKRCLLPSLGLSKHFALKKEQINQATIYG